MRYSVTGEETTPPPEPEDCGQPRCPRCGTLALGGEATHWYRHADPVGGGVLLRDESKDRPVAWTWKCRHGHEWIESV